VAEHVAHHLRRNRFAKRRQHCRDGTLDLLALPGKLTRQVLDLPVTQSLAEQGEHGLRRDLGGLPVEAALLGYTSDEFLIRHLQQSSYANAQ
jgi:hypothetical protein